MRLSFDDCHFTDDDATLCDVDDSTLCSADPPIIDDDSGDGSKDSTGETFSYKRGSDDDDEDISTQANYSYLYARGDRFVSSSAYDCVPIIRYVIM